MEPTMFSSFGALLQTLRTRRGLSQQALANALGVHRNTIGNWERGDKLPDSKAMVLELARALHLDEAETRQLLEASLTAPTLFWHVPYPRNPCFTGREAILQALHTRLAASQPVAFTQSYALSGLGGVGKTQLALEYAYRHALEYHAVLWLAAESRESLMTSWQQIADVLQLPEGKQADQERLIAAVQRWLTTHSTWLLIWDNVEDLELLAHFLPPVRQGAHLLTTRRAAMGTLAEGWEVPLMSHEEGLVLLLRRAKILGLADSTEQLPLIAERHPGEYAAAEDLVRLLEGLPLALDQAGAYAEETAGSLADYLRLYHTHRPELLSRRGDVTSAHPASVVTTWSVAFERLEQTQPAAADLLRLCALLAPEAIPEELFTAGAAQLGQRLGPVAADPLQWQAALRAVLAYSLLHRKSEDHTLSMHRLVQAVLRDGIDQAATRSWAERAVCAMNVVFPEPGVAAWSQCEYLVPHVRVCRQWLDQVGITLPEAAALLSKAGIYLLQRGRYAEAEPLLVQALALQEQRLGNEHPEVAPTLAALGDLLTRQAQYQRAEPLLQRALAIREQSLGPIHPQTAESFDLLASLYWYQSRYAEAEPWFRRALAIREQVLGPTHPQTAESLYNLACQLWQAQGQFQQAEPLFEQAIAVYEQALGETHPETAQCLRMAGAFYRARGKYQRAEALLQRALTIAEQQLGESHPFTTLSLASMGILYREQGKYARAEPLLQRAVSTSEQQLGPDHLQTVARLEHLAELYCEQGKHAQAETLLQRTLALRERLLGPEHPDTAHSLIPLGASFREQGKYAEARPLLERALLICEEQLGPDHLDTARCLRHLGLLSRAQGHSTQAESLLQRALAIHVQALGAEHPDTARCLEALAQVTEVQCRLIEAEQLYQRVLSIQEQALGIEHPTVAATLEQYARLLRQLDRGEEATALQFRAQAIHARVGQQAS